MLQACPWYSKILDTSMEYLQAWNTNVEYVARLSILFASCVFGNGIYVSLHVQYLHIYVCISMLTCLSHLLWLLTNAGVLPNYKHSNSSQTMCQTASNCCKDVYMEANLLQWLWNICIIHIHLVRLVFKTCINMDVECLMQLELNSIQFIQWPYSKLFKVLSQSDSSIVKTLLSISRIHIALLYFTVISFLLALSLLFLIGHSGVCRWKGRVRCPHCHLSWALLSLPLLPGEGQKADLPGPAHGCLLQTERERELWLDGRGWGGGCVRKDMVGGREKESDSSERLDRKNRGYKE